MPTTRDVIATAYKPTGEVWPGAPYEFTLTPGTYLADAGASQFPETTIRRLTLADGTMRVPLQLNSGVLGTQYYVQEPGDKNPYYITVPSGVGDLSLSDARTQYAGLSTPTYANLAAYVDARLAAIVFPWSNISSFVGSSLAQLETRLASDLTGTTLPATVVTSSLTTVGTLVAGAVPLTLLTGTTLPATVVTSSLTSVGTLVSVAVTGTIRSGASSISSGADMEINKATGSATPTAAEIRIRATTSASDWSTTLPWGNLSWYSNDNTGVGVGVRLRISAVMEDADGGSTSMLVQTAPVTAGTMVTAMSITSLGVVSLTKNLVLTAGTTTVAPLQFVGGVLLTTPTARRMEYDTTYYLTNSDAVRRHIVLAPVAAKVTAGAPFANDGYVTMRYGATDIKVMTTA